MKIKEIKPSFTRSIIFTLEDGRVIEMTLTGRETRHSVLRKRAAAEAERAIKDVRDLYQALKEFMFQGELPGRD